MMKNSFKHNITSSLRKKIVIGFIVFFSIPFLFFEIILFRSWLDTTRSIVIEQYETILTEAIESKNQDILSLEKMNDNIYYNYQEDPLIFEKLSKIDNIQSLRNDLYLNTIFDQLTNSYFNQYDGELQYDFFTMNGNLVYQRSNHPFSNPFINYTLNYSEKPWFKQIIERGPVNSVFTAHRSFFQEDDPSIYFSFAQVVRSPFNLEPVGVSMLTINTSIFHSILISESDNQFIKFIVTDSQQNVLYTNSSTDHFSTQFSPVLTKKLVPYQWKIEAFLLNEQLSQKYLHTMIQQNGLFVIANIVLLLIIIGFFTRQLKPLYVLSEKMKKAQAGNFHLKLRNQSADELGMLSNIFNQMTSDIQRLFEKQNQEYQEKLEFQMISLETQINPHFIYNMLDLIQCRVYQGNPDEASDLIVSLSVIMRYITTRPGEKVTCAQELAWLKDYIFLQQQLIGSHVDVDINFDPRILTYKVQKLILQPIIENAYLHGFVSASRQNRLKIKAYKEGNRLVYEVRDNGKGFPNPVHLFITSKNMEMLKDWGVGLYVTAQRFLFHSNHAEIRLISNPDSGTWITMKQNLYD